MTTPTDPASGTDLASMSASRLLAGANHEIRTALHGVVGMLALLRESGLSPSQQEYAESARHGADTLLTLIENLADLSLIESGEFRLTPTSFDLAHEMRASLTEKAAAMQDKGLQLEASYPPSTLLYGDPRCLRQMVGDLLECALALAPSGRASLGTELTSKSTNTCCVRIALDIERANSALESVTVAIAHCAALARAMGGRAGIDRRNDSVTAWLSLELPLAADPLSGGRILLALEQTEARVRLADLLNAHGMRIDICASIAEVRQVLSHGVKQQDPYRIVVLGSQLQGMGAELLATAITQDPTHQHSAVLLLSDSPECDMQALSRAGVAACITGSACQQDIVRALRHLYQDEPLPFFIVGEAAQEASAATAFTQCRVLVADDNAVNRKVASHLLEQLGCTVAFAEDGRQAVHMHASAAYDLILMDCDMPIQDGYAASAHIRRMEDGRRHTPIIALTACTTSSDRERCRAAGMDDFIAKPARGQALQQTLARWLPQVPLHAEPGASDTCDDELDAVRDMFGSDFAELAALYLADGPDRVLALRNAGMANDCDQTAKLAHAFSGSSMSIGATGLGQLCRQLERRAKAGELSDFTQEMDRIEAEYRHISGRLQTLLQ